MVDVIKRRIVGVSDDSPQDRQVEIDMENVMPLRFSTGLNDTTAVTAGQAITLTVKLTDGMDPKTVQWYKDNNAIAGATALTYTKANSAVADSGTYKVVAHDGYGNIISDSTVVTVS
ncbi:immunoglobulin domain-containing protein [Salmonella enterica]|nr:immunoglobulin domain-containing protein [Salmonella enterica]